MALPTAFITALEGALDSRAIIRDPEKLAPHLTEWRGKYHGSAQIMVRPTETRQLEALVQLARAHKIALVPQGGNTGLVGASLPGLEPNRTGPDLLVSMQGFDQIEKIDPVAGTITAGTGVTIAALQDAAQEAGMMFPLSLASEGSCTVGGTIATNAGGIHVIRYGTMRALTLGLEAVLGTGARVDDLAPLIKDNSGYSVRDLLIGSEGTLGFVSRATLKLAPIEAAHITLWLGAKSLEDACEILREARSLAGGTLSAFEIMADHTLNLATKHIAGSKKPVSAPWHLLVEFGLSSASDAVDAALDSWLAQAFRADLLSDGIRAQNESQRRDFWRLRENLSAAQKSEGVSIKHDISLPVAAIPHFVETQTPGIEALYPGSRMMIFGHLGDGNLHYNLLQPPGDAEAFKADWERIQTQVHKAVVAHGGSLSAEHGIGRMKRSDLARFGDPGKLDAMRAIKAALDPDGIMNPGVLFA